MSAMLSIKSITRLPGSSVLHWCRVLSHEEISPDLLDQGYCMQDFKSGGFCYLISQFCRPYRLRMFKRSNRIYMLVHEADQFSLAMSMGLFKNPGEMCPAG